MEIKCPRCNRKAKFRECVCETKMKRGLGYKKVKRISHKRYNKLQHLWRNSKKRRVRKKSYSILCGVIEEV